MTHSDSLTGIKCTFDQVYAALRETPEPTLDSTGGTPFAPKAICALGATVPDKRCILAAPGVRIYSCCWGYGKNHSGTRIGQYVRPLDRWMRRRSGKGDVAWVSGGTRQTEPRSMNRSTYLEDQHVRDFIGWATHLATGEQELAWLDSRMRRFTRASLFRAYESFYWPRPTVPSGNFSDTATLLDSFRRQMHEIAVRDHPTDKDERQFLTIAMKVVKDWGGINNLNLHGLGKGALQKLKTNAILLDPKQADTEKLNRVTYMGTGYSKVYALMIDDFPMYDSRVACALTSLIWMFGGKKARNSKLDLYVPTPREGNRNPHGFTGIRGMPKKKHVDSNLKAAWLLGELSSQGQFARLPAEHRVMALQSALFMIGYRPLTEIRQ